MKFSELSKYLQKLENTTKRLEITAILNDLIKELSVDEADIGIYLSLGYLSAEYDRIKFNIAEKMMIRILSLAYGKKPEDVKRMYSKLGDLGDVAHDLSPGKRKLDPGIKEVHGKLVDIARIEGSGSQGKKISMTVELLNKVDKLSVKYLVRIILGTTRLGFTELTVINALVSFVGGDKETKKNIEAKYFSHPDIGLITRKIKVKGIKGIRGIHVEVGVPIHSQKPQRVESLQEIMDRMKKAWVEYKFDGTRVQLHLDRKREMKIQEQQGIFTLKEKLPFVKTFTRNLEETTHQYPDIVAAADEQVDAESVIIDGEAVGYDKKTGEFLPFQEIMQRKRKHGIAEMAKEIPLRYFVFDLLYLNGESLIELPLKDRRKKLMEVIKGGNVIKVDNHVLIEDVKELADYFGEAKHKGLEGILVKDPEAGYQAGARSYAWIKFKSTEGQVLPDTVDCVVLGYYFGRGERAKFGIGGFLAGVYDAKNDEFKTITKIGTGLKEDDWRYLKAECEKIKVSGPPKRVDVGKKFIPDVWVSLEIVVEVGADEISKSKDHSTGYALRFPRLIRFRDDKKPKDTTSFEEIEQLYKSQKRGYY